MFTRLLHSSRIAFTVLCLASFILCLDSKAQTLTLDELMNLANKQPDSITQYLTNKGWKQYTSDTTRSKNDQSMLEYNAKWGYKTEGDSLGLCWFFYKKKQNTVTGEKGFYENIQYSIACPVCFRDIRDSVLATGWPNIQDDRNDEQVLQTYNAGDFSVLLVTHFKGDKEWYDVVVFRKKPVE